MLPIGELAAFGTASCWTVSALAFEKASRQAGSLAINLIRLIIAFIFLIVWCGFFRGSFFPSGASSHHWVWLSLSGLVGFTLGDLCLFRAFVVVGARLSMLLLSLVPPITALIGLLVIGERLAFIQWFGMLLTVLGIAWVVLERGPAQDGLPRRTPLQGIALGVGGAIGQAVGLVLSKYGMRDLDPFLANQIRIIAGLIGFSTLYLFIGWWPRIVSAFTHWRAMANASLGAFFGPFIGVSLSLFAVRYTETGIAATIMALVPVLIIVPTRFLYKESISLRAIAGAHLAVGGVALLFIK